MSPNFQSLCYLSAWEQGVPVEGGMAWESQLRKCKLDYSWASLERIDYFLDAVRTQRKPSYKDFLSKQANANLLLFIAFYVVELRSRIMGASAELLTYQDAVSRDQKAQIYGEGFHSALIENRGGQQFLPLVSICTRVFDEQPDKSVAFSAGMGMVSPEDKHKVFDGLAPIPLIPDFQSKYQALDIPQGYKRWFESPFPDKFPPNDALSRLKVDAPKLLETGYVVWGAVVQSNNHLSDPGFLDCAPADLVYDPLGRVDKYDLYNVALRLRELRSAEQTDPALEVYASHLRAETSRVFGWCTPRSLYPYELQASSTFFSSEINFPGYALVSPLIPILVSPACPGSIMAAPWQLWPEEDFEEWNTILRSQFGSRAKIHSQRASSKQKVMPAPASTTVNGAGMSREKARNAGFWGRIFGGKK